MNSACLARLNKELSQLEMDPPPGISAWPKDGMINVLESSERSCVLSSGGLERGFHFFMLFLFTFSCFSYPEVSAVF